MAKSTEELALFLQTGSIEALGRLPWSSNYTFLARVYQEDEDMMAVYKPCEGERPLWDFPRGTLHLRECAAFLISHALGWPVVPPTVIRSGPHGVGSIQLFIEHDPDIHYFTFEGDPLFKEQLQKIVLLDFLINNADRKGGHVLLETEADGRQLNRLWAIDHGICFHTEYKLRTVIWEFAGQPIPAHLLTDLVKFKNQFSINGSRTKRQLQKMLNRPEMTALENRLERIIKRGSFWQPGPGRHYPWPPV